MRKKSDLRGYQDRAVSWLYGRNYGLYIAPMGTGKTATALTTIGEMIEDHHARHALIVAPKRVAEITWPKELTEWAHFAGLRAAVCRGSPERRRKTLRTWQTREITIIGIDNVQWLVKELLAFAQPGDGIYDLLVLDETSRLRNPKSKRGKDLLKIRGNFKTVWGLTGTPRPNSELDLYMPAAIISDRQLWPKGFYSWQRERFYTTDYNGWNWVIQPHWRDDTNNEFAQITLAVDENDMPELPDLNFIWDDVFLPDEAMEKYKEMERDLLVELDHRDVEAVNAGVAVGKLTQIAAGYIYGEGGRKDVEPIHDAKLEWLAELIEDLQGEPLLVVYEHVEDIKLIEMAAGGAVPRLGSGVTDYESRRYIDGWNAGLFPVMAIHPASAGHGLNLQHGGHRIAWLSPCWSAEYWDQTIARLHRSGQTHPVYVHVAMAVDTIDHAKRMRVFEKLSAQESLKKYLKKA